MFTDALLKTNNTWTVKTDDFFPYADNPHAFWTGYFTSRPALKRYVRVAEAYLQPARHFDVFNGGDGSRLEHYTEMIGQAQHHDAVSGTEKQHVAYDYARGIAEGVADANAIIAEALAKLLKRSPSSPTPPAVSFCPLSNVSVCPPTQTGSPVALVIYNPIARSLGSVSIRVPVSGPTTVYDTNGAHVGSSLVPNYVTLDPAGSKWTLMFSAALPPMGYSTYFLQPGSGGNEAEPVLRRHNADARIANEFLAVTIDGTSGRIKEIENVVSGVSTSVMQDWYWYNSSAGGSNWGQTDYKQNSGAYIFRPNSSTPFAVNSGSINFTVSLLPGGVSEVFQYWAPWLTQTVRLVPGGRYVEVEYNVGPVPIDNQCGHEVITRWSSDIASASTWYTDSNGREFITRVKDYRPTWKLNATEPVSENYYPVNAAMYLNDATRRLTILTERSQGGASLADGQMELMVHRRLLFDDSRGVGEPLNET